MGLGLIARYAQEYGFPGDRVQCRGACDSAARPSKLIACLQVWVIMDSYLSSYRHPSFLLWIASFICASYLTVCQRMMATVPHSIQSKANLGHAKHCWCQLICTCCCSLNTANEMESTSCFARNNCNDSHIHKASPSSAQSQPAHSADRLRCKYRIW